MKYALYEALTGRIVQVMFGPQEDCSSVAVSRNLLCLSVGPEVNDATHRVVDGVAELFPTKPGPWYAWNWETLEWVNGYSVDLARTKKNAQINLWRQEANEKFLHESKWFSADPLSWKDVTGIQGYVAEYADLPVWFPGFWKAVDNTYLDIEDVAAWQAFYAAALLRGATNFAHSEELKAYVGDSSRTTAEIDAVVW